MQRSQAASRTVSQNLLLSRRTSSLSFLAIFVLCNLWYYSSFLTNYSQQTAVIPIHAQETLSKCRQLHLKPGVPDDFYERKTSDRFQLGTSPVLIRNATIWTGRVNGLEVLKGDLLLGGGLIKEVGPLGEDALRDLHDLKVIDANE